MGKTWKRVMKRGFTLEAMVLCELFSVLMCYNVKQSIYYQRVTIPKGIYYTTLCRCEKWTDHLRVVLETYSPYSDFVTRLV